MKKIVILAALFALPAFAATKNYSISPKDSNIEWVGTKVTGKHTGTVNLKSGTLVTKDDKLSGGEFVIDMTSLDDKDLTDKGYHDKLVTHLNSEDFFATKENPEAKFVISNAKAKADGEYDINGNLTIKKITNPVSFVAKVTKAANGLEVVADNIKVDRTKYNIKYGSGKFFQGLGDKLIHDEFTVNVKLSAVEAPKAEKAPKAKAKK